MPGRSFCFLSASVSKFRIARRRRISDTGFGNVRFVALNHAGSETQDNSFWFLVEHLGPPFSVCQPSQWQLAEGAFLYSDDVECALNFRACLLKYELAERPALLQVGT